MKGVGAGTGFIIGFILVAMLMVGLLLGLGVIKLPAVEEAIEEFEEEEEIIVEGYPCQTDGTNSLFVAARNPLNTSLEYQAGTAYVVNSKGEVIASGTLNAGETLSFKEIDVPCSADNAKGKVYIVADSARDSAEGTYSFEKATSYTIQLKQADQDQLTFIFYDSTLTNTSNPDTGTKGGATETTAVAMSSGDTRNGYLDVKQGTGSAQMGSTHHGLFWCYDSVNSAAFSDTSLALTSQSGGFSLNEVSCSLYPKATAVDSCNRCWTSRAIKAQDGTLRLAWTLSNDGGTDAGASDDVKLYVNDIVYFLDTDGKIKLEVYNAAGTDQGETKCTNTWAIS